jgi:peptidoglycan/LPS O-acetylase OafA/YrhL
MSLMKYRPDIDGLRAIAVLAVVIHHLSPSLLPGGYIGVDIFFVISGYLITKIIDREISDGTFTYVNFYERRVRRIFPALFAVLIATFLTGYLILLPSDYASTLKATVGAVFFSSNFVFWREMKEGYFAATDAGLNPLLHTWSLAVEEQFYILFPVLLLVCTKYFRKHTKAILLITALLSLTAAVALIKSKSVAVFFLSPFRIWELLAGSLLAVNALPKVNGRVARELTALLGLTGILAACLIYTPQTIFPGIAAAIPVLGAAALIHSGSSGATFITSFLTVRPMVFVGLISYSLYLWHWPLIVFTRYHFGTAPLDNFFFSLFAASIGLGYLSYRFIELPFRQRDSFFTRSRLFALSTIGAISLTVIPALGLIQGGFETRYSSTVIKLDQARRPSIPFRTCDAKTAKDWCRLGKQTSVPNIFLWGDSHLLSWAPALNEILEKNATSAVFATRSACPPLFGVISTMRPACEPQNNVVKQYLTDNPNIDTVVLAGFWSLYFNTEGELTPTNKFDSKERGIVVQTALLATIDWLRSNKKKVILIGPVPVFDKSVPLALALEEAWGRSLFHSSFEEQKKLHSRFFEAIDLGRSAQEFVFLDPIEWLCKKNCKAIESGIPLYRDAHHLSIFGAMMLKARLSEGFTRAQVEYGIGTTAKAFE